MPGFADAEIDNRLAGLRRRQQFGKAHERRTRIDDGGRRGTLAFGAVHGHHYTRPDLPLPRTLKPARVKTRLTIAVKRARSRRKRTASPMRFQHSMFWISRTAAFGFSCPRYCRPAVVKRIVRSFRSGALRWAGRMSGSLAALEITAGLVNREMTLMSEYGRVEINPKVMLGKPVFKAPVLPEPICGNSARAPLPRTSRKRTLISQ